MPGKYCSGFSPNRISLPRRSRDRGLRRGFDRLLLALAVVVLGVVEFVVEGIIGGYHTDRISEQPLGL